MYKKARPLLALGLLMFLMVAEPKPANAIFCSNCTNQWWETIKWAKDNIAWAIQWAAEGAQWVAENTQRSAASVANILKDKLNFEKDMKLAEAAHQEAMNSNVRAELGTIARQNAVSSTSTACVMSASAATNSNAKMAMKTLGRALRKGLNTRGGGATAPAPGSVQADAKEVRQLCDLGFIDPARYSTEMLSAMNCTSVSGSFEGADISIDSLLEPMQYYMPKNMKIDPDGGGVTFSGVTDQEKPFVAAYYFCQNIAPDIPKASATKGTITPSDVQSLRADRTNAAMRSGAVSECINAILYRTACPTGSANVLKDTQGRSCHDHQVAQCHLLRDGTPPTGYKLTFSGANAEYQAALANCDGQGLSEAMYDAMIANRCADTNYMTTLAANLGNQEVYNKIVEFDCRDSITRWSDNLDREKERVQGAIWAMMNMRNMNLSGGSGVSTKIIQ